MASPLGRRGWTGRGSLVRRILAINILTIGLLALSIFTLDRYRNQLAIERTRALGDEARLLAAAIALDKTDRTAALLDAVSRRDGSRIRIYDADGRLALDSWTGRPPTYALRDPASQGWNKDLARAADRGFNWLVGSPPDEPFAEPQIDRLSAWSEALQAKRFGGAPTRQRAAPDYTPVFSAAAPTRDGAVVLVTRNDRDYTRTVRSQRRALLVAMGAALLLSGLVSFYLARTIVRPIRRLAIAAHRVRLGRAREVKVPRLARRDEIGLLATAVADMTQALRERMDRTEAFAADVSHELKNPLASLRSAVDGLDRIDDPALRRQLLDVVRQDVLRLDRLIGDIADAARTDSQLAHARFEPIDIGSMVGDVVAAWEERRETGNVRLAFARPRKGSTIVAGDGARLARAVDNLIDNAISFSPPGGLVEVSVARVADLVSIRVEDEGPGVPDGLKEAIFNRFHSVRPETENFGRHSGLGLAIAQAIVEGHDGEIDVTDRDDAPSGARFTIQLPALVEEAI